MSATPSLSPQVSPQQPGHVLFITGEYPPMPGGVGAYTAELGAALVSRGWRVSVLTSGVAQPLSPSSSSGSNPAPIAVYPILDRWGWNILGDALQWAKVTGADWLHVQYQTGAFQMHPAINLAPDWWHRQGLHIAWTYHDILVPYLFPKAGTRLRRWVTDRPAAVSDLTIATNGGDAQHLRPLARNLATIPIGSNIQAIRFTDDERHARRFQRGYALDDVVVGYFGFLNRSKGALVLVETLARLLPDLPTLRLLMIGEQVGASDSSNQAYLQEVKAALDAHGLTDRVLWTGYQPEAEVSADLEACDLLFMPYLDGASLRRGTLMAGLAHGCAIVTTTPSAPIPELVKGRDLLYVPPGDAEASAAAILELVRQPALMIELRENARAASAAFTWEGIAEAHERLYLAS
jgi:glycosyltransferase involved in cell wall biosynthesis